VGQQLYLGCGKWNMGPFPIEKSCLESQLSKTQNKWKWVDVVMDLFTLVLGELFIAWTHFDIVKGVQSIYELALVDIGLWY